MKTMIPFLKAFVMLILLVGFLQSVFGDEAWKPLFDGKTTDGWRGIGKDSFPSRGWVIEDGCLKHVDRGGGGDLITTGQYEEFEFSFEWKVAPGANSGVKYFVIEERGSIGHEYQIIDDARHPDASRGNDHGTACFYDVLPATNKVLKPAGEFNHSRIRVQGNRVEHWLNENKVLEYELDSPELQAAIQRSKFRDQKIFGARIKGHLLLQDHGDEVWFRNLKIRDLSED